MRIRIDRPRPNQVAALVLPLLDDARYCCFANTVDREKMPKCAKRAQDMHSRHLLLRWTAKVECYFQPGCRPIDDAQVHDGAAF